MSVPQPLQKTAVIIGAGPAGLTAALELLRQTDIKPIVFEMTGDIGGLAKTINYKGNRIDIGGHRFFSKSDRVMEWWLKILPLQSVKEGSQEIFYHNKKRTIPLSAEGADPETEDLVMLIRKRLSRVFFLGKFFDYPIAFNSSTLKQLGLWRTGKIAVSYVKVRLFPIRKEKNLEDFFINRFGRELYLTFFKDYTEKVWGFRCEEIPPEWGMQRIKGLSISKAIKHAITQRLSGKKQTIQQKEVETSLIEQFLYPKKGPGQLWEEVAALVTSLGGEIHLHKQAVKIENSDNRIQSVTFKDKKTGKLQRYAADYVFSTMPVKELVAGLTKKPPMEVARVGAGLLYRDFITVGLLLKDMSGSSVQNGHIPPDNWIYIQEKNVKVGRLQIFNNWSPYMVENSEYVWVGMEYFVNEGDELWEMPDVKLQQFAIQEMISLKLIKKEDVLDATVLRMPKAYPSYTGTYEHFKVIREYFDTFSNLFLIGRNGMHHYNNQDHSMLTAMLAVENIVQGKTEKDNLWEVNTEDEYHETRS